jgi:hypothetical protein
LLVDVKGIEERYDISDSGGGILKEFCDVVDVAVWLLVGL